MSAARFTGAEGAVDQLAAHGVRIVFGIPGVHNLALFEALDRSSIRTVLVRHEQTAVYAADGYARATGRVGVALTTTGPGAANAAAAMGEARAARSPLLHISTQLPTSVLEGRSGRGGLHEAPMQREMMAAVSVWSERVSKAAAIPSLISRGFQEALSGRRGPAFLEIPLDLLEEEIPASRAPVREPRFHEPDPKQVERAVAMLSRSKAPLIWAGGGAVDAAAQIRELAELLNAPVVTTFSGRGILPASHPLSVPMPPHQPKVTELIESSDLILIIGSDLDAMNTMGWRIALPRPRVSINTVADDSRRNYAADLAMETDASRGVSAILESFARKRSFKAKGDGERRARTAGTSSIRSLKASKKLAPGFTLAQQIGEAAEAAEATVVCDMAVAGYWTGGYARFEEPRRLLYPLGWGTLGFSLPAAVGAASEGRRVLVVCGDAGAMYALGELATLVQQDLDVCVLIVDDGGYGMLRVDTEMRFGRRFADKLVVPDLIQLADSFAVPARKATLRTAATALRWGLKQQGPSLIALRAALEPPPTTSPRWHRRGEKERRP